MAKCYTIENNISSQRNDVVHSENMSIVTKACDSYLLAFYSMEFILTAYVGSQGDSGFSIAAVFDLLHGSV